MGVCTHSGQQTQVLSASDLAGQLLPAFLQALDRNRLKRFQLLCPEGDAQLLQQPAELFQSRIHPPLGIELLVAFLIELPELLQFQHIGAVT